MSYSVEVGKLLFSNKTRLPEGTFLEYDQNGPMLIFSLRNLTDSEIQAFKTGRIDLALYVTDPVIWFLHRIEKFEDWSDTPFSIRLYDDKGIKFDWSQPIKEGMGLALHLILVDSSTGIIKAQRLVGMPTRFSRMFRQAILDQLQKPFSIEEYHNVINRIYRNFTARDLLQRADIKQSLKEPWK